MSRALGMAALSTPRWRDTLPIRDTDGPPPQLAVAARHVYEATAGVLAILTLLTAYDAILGVAPRQAMTYIVIRGWGGAMLSGWLAAYAFGLARGVARLASPDRRPAGPWSCAPLIVHGLAGLYGSIGLLVGPYLPRSFAGALDVGLRCAYFGLIGGWIVVIPTAARLARGAPLFVWSVAGPIGGLALAPWIAVIGRFAD